MIAVTACCGTDMPTFFIAGTSPNKAVRSLVTMHGVVGRGDAAGSDARTCTVGVATRAGFSGSTSVDWSTET